MAVTALALFAVYLGVGFVLRSWLQWRRTGDTGFRGISGRPGSAEWLAGVGFVLALVAGVLGPVAALVGLDPVGWLAAPAATWSGLVLAVAGIAATLATQLNMGTSWRIGVDATERTALVTTGAFAWVRNPIFTAMALTGAGLALMAPNVVALLGLVLLVVALQLQVRVVEEPYLRAVHGVAYAVYAASTGRFVPGLGRLRSTDAAAAAGGTGASSTSGAR
jgi:protein-S-isoprenylcysteine O-methyltransferase Ste14